MPVFTIFTQGRLGTRSGAIAGRRQGGSIGGRWEFPGGKTEEGETPQAALAREIREEFGAGISVGALLASADFSNNGMDYRVMAFEAVLTTPLRVLAEHEEIRWLSFGEIAALDLADSDRLLYETLRKEGFPAQPSGAAVFPRREG